MNIFIVTLSNSESVFTFSSAEKAIGFIFDFSREIHGVLDHEVESTGTDTFSIFTDAGEVIFTLHSQEIDNPVF